MFNWKYWLIRTFRCRLFGFLLGSTLAGASVYYYILEEYKVSNEMLTEDIYVSAPCAAILGTHTIAYTSDDNWEVLQKHGVMASFEEERVAPHNLFLTFHSSLDISYALCNGSFDTIVNIALPGPTSSRTTNLWIRFRDEE